METTLSPTDEKLREILTQEKLRTIYSGATGLSDMPKNLNFTSTIVYSGLLTHVSSVVISPEHDPSASACVIAKRYVPPEEQILTFAGHESVPLLDRQEYIHLAQLHIINQNQPKPYFHDPHHHLVVMEALDDSYHNFLDATYSRFSRANQRARRRISLKVRGDLETILDQTAKIFHTVTEQVHHGQGSYVISQLNRDTLLARHDRGLAAVVSLGLRLNLSELVNLPPKLILKQITPGTVAREAGVWFNKYNIARERDVMFSYLELQEAINHGDLLPGNILCRENATDKPTHFSLCDLGKLYKAPFDFDMLTLLMVDPRIKLMLSLPERRAIYDDFFDVFANNSFQSASYLSPDARFTIGSIASLLRYIGSIYFYIDQKDPKASVEAQGDLSLLEKIDPHLPFKPDRYFGIQYASLLELLHTEPARNLFPNLLKGASYFFDPKTQVELKELLQDTRKTYQKLADRFKRFIDWSQRNITGNLRNAIF